MPILDGRVALITGAARGQGQAEAERFVAEGAKVMLTDVLDDRGQSVAAPLGDGAVYRHLDVTSARDWTSALDELIARWGKVDVLVNNAAIHRVATFAEPSESFGNSANSASPSNSSLRPESARIVFTAI